MSELWKTFGTLGSKVCMRVKLWCLSVETATGCNVWRKLKRYVVNNSYIFIDFSIYILYIYIAVYTLLISLSLLFNYILLLSLSYNFLVVWVWRSVNVSVVVFHVKIHYAIQVHYIYIYVHTLYYVCEINLPILIFL